MTAKDMAIRNCGRTWTIEMLKALVVNENINFTAEDFEEITAEQYTVN